MSLTWMPLFRGFSKPNNPPVVEITWSLPCTRLPFSQRRTAWVISVKQVRGARFRACCGEGLNIVAGISMEAFWAQREITEGRVSGWSLTCELQDCRCDISTSRKRAQKCDSQTHQKNPPSCSHKKRRDEDGETICRRLF